MEKTVLLCLLMIKIHHATASTWTFVCSVSGPGTTVWQGSAFYCPGQQNQIVLLHSRYNSSNGTYTSNSCNKGDNITIIPQIIGVSENIYTSRVTISDSALNSSLIGKSVECVHDNGTAAEVVLTYMIINYDSLNDLNDKILVLILTTQNSKCTDLEQRKLLIISTNCFVVIIALGILILPLVLLLVCQYRRKKNSPRSTNDDDHVSNKEVSTVDLVLYKHEIQSKCQLSGEKTTSNNTENFCLNNSDNGNKEKTTYRNCTTIEDNSIDLDSILIELKGKLDDKFWYQFGVALGVPKDFLEGVKGCPAYECMTELIDYWLCNHQGQPSLKEIDDAIREIATLS